MKSGILIIGSLLWENKENSSNKEKGKQRADWREEHLSEKDKITVCAPIRYGRKSSGDSYTMVFSKEIEENNKNGTAFIIPFKKEITSFDDLLQQVYNLSEAEGAKDKKLLKGKTEKWCVIGVLFNPAFSKIKKEEILSKYREELNKENFSEYYADFKLGAEKSIIKESGEIDISWLKSTNSNESELVNGFDFVIATCTKPRTDNNLYPSAEEISELLSVDKRNYFHNNIKNGITTFQDKEILDLQNE